MWEIVGWACTAYACMWQAPVTARMFTIEAECLGAIMAGPDESLVKFRDNKSDYAALKCRRTDNRRRE